MTFEKDAVVEIVLLLRLMILGFFTVDDDAVMDQHKKQKSQTCELVEEKPVVTGLDKKKPR
jgi:hypothetical protein